MTWSVTSKNIIDSIKNAITEIGHTSLQERNIKIKIYTYSSFPSVRGFKVNHTYLMTYSHCKNGIADFPHYFYERFDENDNSLRAEFYKDYFDNYLSHYFLNATCIFKLKKFIYSSNLSFAKT